MDEELKKLWDSIYAEEKASLSPLTYGYSFQRIADYCKLVLDGKQDKLVVDWGCGKGDLLKILSNLYPRNNFVGVDVSEKAIEIARKDNQFSNNVAFYSSDVNKEIGRVNGMYFSLGINILQCLENPLEALKSIKGKTTDNGYTLITLPSYEDALELFPASFFTQNGDFHYLSHPKATMKQMLLERNRFLEAVSDEFRLIAYERLNIDSHAVRGIADMVGSIDVDSSRELKKKADNLMELMKKDEPEYKRVGPKVDCYLLQV